MGNLWRIHIYIYILLYILQHDYIHIYIYTDWWFGTMEFYDFPYIGNNIPNWRTHIFQRGRYTTNQYWLSIGFVIDQESSIKVLSWLKIVNVLANLLLSMVELVLTNKLNMRLCWYPRFTMMEETWGHPRLICQCQPCQPRNPCEIVCCLIRDEGLERFIHCHSTCWRSSSVGENPLVFIGFSHMGLIHSTYPIISHLHVGEQLTLSILYSGHDIESLGISPAVPWYSHHMVSWIAPPRGAPWLHAQLSCFRTS